MKEGEMFEPRLDDPGQWLLAFLSLVFLVLCLTAP